MRGSKESGSKVINIEPQIGPHKLLESAREEKVALLFILEDLDRIALTIWWSRRTG